MTPEVERLVESGRQAETEGTVREALVRFEAAVKLAGNEAVPRLRLGTLCHRIGEGEAEFDQVSAATLAMSSGMRYSVKKRTEKGMANPMMFPRMPPIREMETASARN